MIGSSEVDFVGCDADFGLSQMQTPDHKTTLGIGSIGFLPKISHKHLTSKAECHRQGSMFGPQHAFVRLSLLLFALYCRFVMGIRF